MYQKFSYLAMAHSAPLQNTGFWLEFCHGWPLEIYLNYVKYKCFMPAACVDRSLQLSISAEIIQTASHFKLRSEYKT